MKFPKTTYYFKLISILIIVLLLAESCGPKRALVSQGSSKRHSRKDHRNNMSARSRGDNKPPQMGFYARKQSRGIFQTTKFGIQYLFASKSKRHKLGNDQRSTSQANNNQLNKKSELNTKGFINKQAVVNKATNNLGFDNTNDSFSKNPNKREKPQSGIHKRHR